MEQSAQFLGIDRRKMILDYIEEHQSAAVKELAELYEVSEMTIRRDFHYLEEIGVVEVYYGGARLRKERLEVPSFFRRDKLGNPDKKAIARTAGAYVKEGDTIFLEVSSTVSYILSYLPDIHLTVITNSMPVIQKLYANPKIKLIMAPGQYNMDVAGTADLSTVEYIRRFHVDKAFIGAWSCAPQFGVACTNEIEGAIKYQMWKNAKESFLMVDHTKFNIAGPIFHNELSDYDYILTDEEIDLDIKKQVQKQGGRLIICNR